MIFWCSGSGLTYDWAWKIIPWYEAPRGMAVSWMIDSGVRAKPPTIDELLDSQMKYADVGVCPDILMNPKETALRTKEWLNRMPVTVRFRKVLCTQGTIEERVKLIKIFHKEVDWAGAGLARKSPTKSFTDDERIEIIEAITPIAKSYGLRFHVFGTGCGGGGRVMDIMKRVGVDSFDSSSPLLAAKNGCIIGTNLKQIWVGGGTKADDNRTRSCVSLRNIKWVLENELDRRDSLMSDDPKVYSFSIAGVTMNDRQTILRRLRTALRSRMKDKKDNEEWEMRLGQIKTRVRPEPENEFDNDALAIDIFSSSRGWLNIGYVPKKSKLTGRKTSAPMNKVVGVLVRKKFITDIHLTKLAYFRRDDEEYKRRIRIIYFAEVTIEYETE